MSTAMVRLEEINAIMPRLCEKCQDELGDLKTVYVAGAAVEGLGALLQRIAVESGTAPELLRGPERTTSRVKARRRFCVAARALGYSLTEIGNAIGRHYTSVMHLLATESAEGPDASRATKKTQAPERREEERGAQ